MGVKKGVPHFVGICEIVKQSKAVVVKTKVLGAL